MSNTEEKKQGSLVTALSNGKKGVLETRQKLAIGSLLRTGEEILYKAKIQIQGKKAVLEEMKDMAPTNKMSLIATELNEEQRQQRIRELYKLSLEIKEEERFLTHYQTTHTELFGDAKADDYI